MKYFIVAPAGIESGGPELAHQMCNTLMQLGCQAYMYYIGNWTTAPVDVEACKKYHKYRTTHITEKTEIEDDSIVIIPEGATEWIGYISKGKKILWWMSVDNYIEATKEKDLEYICSEVVCHLVQSYYAKDYLLKRANVREDKILYVADYIGDAYRQEKISYEYRKNRVVFNPKKGYEDLKPLIEITPWLEWFPLIGMTEEQMINVMKSAKIYVDFGKHPGKDRIPREAASCGCCVITNKKGSAAYWEDVPIGEKYKFEDVHNSYEAIKLLLKDICYHYEEHVKEFENYRQIIEKEKKGFLSDVKSMVGYLNEKSQNGLDISFE